VFGTIASQWRWSEGKRKGLDYNVLFVRLDRLNLSPREYDWCFEDVQIMEDAVLGAQNKG